MAGTATAASISSNVNPAGGGRLLSLDVFRGLVVALMIVVNNGSGPSFHQLEHSQWNGCTATDLVFPFFMFITGVSLVFSFSSRLTATSKAAQLPHILRRAAIIFALGLILNGCPFFVLHTWRVCGVLQRIAIGYLVGSVLYLWSGRRARWAVIAACLLGYWILMRWVPVPGFGVPTVNVPLLDLHGNLATWLDRKLLAGHLYEPWGDPEGLLSTIPAMANVLFGVAVGEWLRELRQQPGRLLQRLAALGTLCVSAALLWNTVFPINKKLWTSSYVLLTVGLATLAFAACYWLLDVKQRRGRWTVFALVLGTNTIFAYAFSEFVAIFLWFTKVNFHGKLTSLRDICDEVTFRDVVPDQWASLGFALSFLAICWAATWLLYRRRIFIKI